MARTVSTVIGLLLLMLGSSGCADMRSAPVATAQQECERSGGIWRTGSCERASGGGGY
jgi:hypothetical protein